jgi:hypothetical protein
MNTTDRAQAHAHRAKLLPARVQEPVSPGDEGSRPTATVTALTRRFKVCLAALGAPLLMQSAPGRDGTGGVGERLAQGLSDIALMVGDAIGGV